MFELLFGQNAGWFAVPALVGSVFFLLRMAGFALGLDHGVDMPDGADVPGDVHADSTDTFKVLSLQSVAAFLMGFGWAGFGAYRGSGLDWIASAVIGVVGGAAMVFLLARLLRGVARLESSGNLSAEAALGAEGEVYVTVPAQGGGRGQVRVVIGDRQRIFNAVSQGEALPPPTRVRVLRVNEDRSLIVAPAA